MSTPSVLDQPVDGLAEERLGRLQRLGPAVTEQQPVADLEFVALGVSAEIIVVVEDQDARSRGRSASR